VPKFSLRIDGIIQAIIKPQYVDNIPKAVKGSVEKILAQKDERKEQQRLQESLGIVCI
jgi:ATP-binding cassette subfamily E protein 1